MARGSWITKIKTISLIFYGGNRVGNWFLPMKQVKLGGV